MIIIIEKFKKPIYITRPLLPQINDVLVKIKEIWDSQWLTNMGIQHETFENELTKFLEVNNVSLFCNGTLALYLAIQALELKGEVITTPFTFPATTHSLIQNSLKPIYCDINLEDYNINPDEIESKITSKTSAILPVHVFGNPCNVERIEKIAKIYNLKVIYDAAHCFGVKYKNVGIGNYGDISMFSFHAAKIFHTLEGGALTYNNNDLKETLYLLKNFGIKNPEEIILPGTNAKMNEFQAAIGLLNLKLIEGEINKRKKNTFIYKEKLRNVKGIKYLDEKRDVKYNYQYFPILIDELQCKLNRDQVHENLKEYNVFSRKYFYPLCTDYKFSVNVNNKLLPNARKISNQILCLPLYGNLTHLMIEKICDIIISIFKIK